MGDRHKEAEELRDQVKEMTEEECKDTFGLSKEDMNNKITNDEHRKQTRE